MLDGIVVCAFERDIPDEGAQIAIAVDLAEEEIVVGVEPVRAGQQVGPASCAGRQAVDVEVEGIAVGEGVADLAGALGKKLFLLAIDNDAVPACAAFPVFDRDDADLLLGVVRIDDDGLDQRGIEIAETDMAGVLIDEGRIALLAEQGELADLLFKLQVHAVDRVVPEAIEHRLGFLVVHLEFDAVGEQVGQRQLDDAVRHQVGLP